MKAGKGEAKMSDMSNWEDDENVLLIVIGGSVVTWILLLSMLFLLDSSAFDLIIVTSYLWVPAVWAIVAYAYVNQVRQRSFIKRDAKTEKRPTGVTILAILYLIGGVVSIGSGIIYILLIMMGGVVSIGSGIIYIQRITTSPLSYVYTNSGISWMLTFVVVVSFISAIVYFITGWGLWRLRPWARIVALILAVIGILSIYGIPISVIIIWYLLQPEVKAAFQPTPFRPETRRTPTTDKTLDIYTPIDTLKQWDTVTSISNIEEVGKYAECPYCGSNIRETFYEHGGIVRCNKCGAFHHKECFEYYGNKCGSSSCKLREA